MDIPVELSRILITELGESQVIFLKETGGERSFPILIGIFEAQAIDNRLKGVEFPRPMTHDLLSETIKAMGGRLEKIVINDLYEHTFVASLFVERGGELIEIDSRPSDAIALAAGLDTPIFVAEKVFEAVTANTANTREGRLEMLRQRREMLAEQISQFQEMLDTTNLTSEIDPVDREEYQQQLAKMQTEYKAISEILDRLK